MEEAIDICQTADILIIIGTSMQVYPAASLMHYVPTETAIFYIDPNPSINAHGNLTVIAEPAKVGVKKAMNILKNYL
jgi:NAD-dependent deacetylase